jgi:hypothetical protein
LILPNDKPEYSDEKPPHSGVTSLGLALANSLAMPHHDTDDYFWRPTIPPYREMREPIEHLNLVHEMFLPRADWVLSGSLNGWGDVLIPDFDRS